MKSIGILYIATGYYTVFWENFYKTFEQYFLPNMERHYYVFTDAEKLYGEEENDRIHRIYLKAEPWPLPTLLKYHRFLEIEEELRKRDYLYQSNGPIICEQEVKEEEFLPRQALGENLMFTLHPGYYQKKSRLYPYERNKRSTAYVPYNCGKTYVFGAMNGGTSEAYIAFMKELDKNIVADLNHGIIAKYHDESHVNYKVCLLENYRLLPFAFGYPDGISVPGERIISCVNKSKFFDVDSFKGQRKGSKENSNISVLWEKHIASRCKLLFDLIRNKKVN